MTMGTMHLPNLASQTVRNALGVSLCVLLLSAVVQACGAGGVRPRFHSFPGAPADTVTMPPDSAIVVAAAALEAQGIELHHVRPREGYLETHWFNARTGERGSAESVRTDVMTIIRLWADAVTDDQTLLTGEAIQHRFVDPSLPTREKEQLVDAQHPAYDILRRVLAQVKEGTTKERPE